MARTAARVAVQQPVQEAAGLVCGQRRQRRVPTARSGHVPGAHVLLVRPVRPRPDSAGKRTLNSTCTINSKINGTPKVSTCPFRSYSLF